MHKLGNGLRYCSLLRAAAVFWDVKHCVTSQKTAAKETRSSHANKRVLLLIMICKDYESAFDAVTLIQIP